MKEESVMFSKKLFVLAFNILFLIILLFCADYIVYKFFYPPMEDGCFDYDSLFTIGKKVLDKNNFEELYNPYREVAGKNFQNRNIIIFGCSYAYGHMLQENQTFHYKLSQHLKRPVYNYAYPGESTQFALMKIQSHSVDNIIKKSDYAILITIGEHIWRLHANSNGYPHELTWPRYEKKGDNLVFHKTRVPIIEASYVYKYLRKLLYARILSTCSSKYIQNYLFDFMKLHYIEIKKELEKINPDIKIIIIPYLDSYGFDWFIFSDRWKELEEDGFIIVKVDNYIPNLRDIEYIISENDGHPSEKAWTEITDLLCNKLKIFSTTQ